MSKHLGLFYLVSKEPRRLTGLESKRPELIGRLVDIGRAPKKIDYYGSRIRDVTTAKLNDLTTLKYCDMCELFIDVNENHLHSHGNESSITNDIALAISVDLASSNLELSKIYLDSFIKKQNLPSSSDSHYEYKSDEFNDSRPRKIRTRRTTKKISTKSISSEVKPNALQELPAVESSSVEEDSFTSNDRHDCEPEDNSQDELDSVSILNFPPSSDMPSIDGANTVDQNDNVERTILMRGTRKFVLSIDNCVFTIDSFNNEKIYRAESKSMTLSSNAIAKLAARSFVDMKKREGYEEVSESRG